MSHTQAIDESKPQEKPDAAEPIAAYLARMRYDDLPAAVVSAVKISILDTLGCIIAGTSTADVATISSMVRAWGGAPTCTVIGSGGLKLPPISAAFINGAAIHQHDFDDVHDAVTCHPTASTLVPALAAAEEGQGITGRDLILAVALGSDLTCRVSRAIVGAHGHPWYRAPVVGMFGATAAAAKIFGAAGRRKRPSIRGQYSTKVFLHFHQPRRRSYRETRRGWLSGKSMTKGKLEQGDYIRSLEKGLAIVKAFGQDDPTLTLSEAAAKTGMTRAAARRFLLTLTHLGYLEVDGKSFRLRPKILELGERYLTSQPWWNVAQPLIEEAVRKMGESCSLCILDGAEIVYVCRVAVSRLISTNISIGSRLPAYPTALGRVLLAQRSENERKELLAEAHLEKYTKNTVTEKRKLLQIIKQTQSDGFCLIDQELDVGLVGLAVPVCRGQEGFAALGVSVHAGRVSTKEMMSRLLPILKETADRIDRGMMRASAP